MLLGCAETLTATQCDAPFLIMAQDLRSPGLEDTVSVDTLAGIHPEQSVNTLFSHSPSYFDQTLG